MNEAKKLSESCPDELDPEYLQALEKCRQLAIKLLEMALQGIEGADQQ